MMSMKSIIYSLVLSASFGAFAEGGGMASGGGKSIVCFDSAEVTQKIKTNSHNIGEADLSAITSIEMLDLHFAKEPRGLGRNVSKIVTSNDFQKTIEQLILRIEDSVPVFGKLIRKSQKLFKDENIFFRTSAIEMIYDENDTSTNESDLCVLTTMARQFIDRNENILHIDERLFFHPKHSEISKATLLLHEYIYFIAREKGHEDSRKVRDIVSEFIKNDDEVALISLTDKIYRAGLLPLTPYDMEDGIDIFHNSSTGKKVDSVLYTRPMDFLFNWTSSLFLTINLELKEFDTKRDIALKPIKEIFANTQYLAKLAGVKAPEKFLYLTQVQIFLDKNKKKLLAKDSVKSFVIALMADVQSYSESRISVLEKKMSELLEGQKELIYEHEFKDSFLGREVFESLMDTLERIAAKRINLLRTRKIGGIHCSLDRCSGINVRHMQDFSLESRMGEFYYHLADYTDESLVRGQAKSMHMGWIKARIYQEYHNQSILDLKKVYLPKI